MRTTLTLDDDVFESARALARTSGRKLGKVVSELARRGLKSRSPIDERGPVPTFVVPRDADVIPTDRAARILAEEDV